MNFNDFYLNKEILFSMISQEEIFAKYLYVPDLSKKYTNPFRKDESPDCKFYYNKNDVLYFYDFAWNKSYDCFNVVQQIYNCNFAQSLHKIYEDLSKEINLPQRNKIVVERKVPDGLKVKTRNFKPEELKFWCIGGLDITQEELNKAGIYAVETIWEYDYIIDNCKMTFVYIDDGVVTQIYKPLNKGTAKRRFINAPGFTVGGFNSLPYIADYVIITKAGKCNFFLRHFDIASFYVVNEHIILPQDKIDFLKLQYKNVYTLFDFDRAGFHLAWMYRKLYGIQPLFVPIKKDTTEFLGTVGWQQFVEYKEFLESKLPIQ